jgi:hypothetical protein
MQRRKFTWEFKVETVRMTEERGVSVAQASRDSARETGRKSPSGKVRKDAFGAFPFDVRKQLRATRITAGAI